MDKCDMCGSKIIENKCDCGEWKSKEETENDPMKLALEQFHEMKIFSFTGDAPYMGCAVVFFRGDYNDSKKVQEFIYKMKGRPFYNEK